MRIGISTYHSCLNDGAILQAYCLASALKERIQGAEVEIVDYRHPSERQVYGPPDDRRKKALSEFVDKVLPLSRERFEDEDPPQGPRVHLQELRHARGGKRRGLEAGVQASVWGGFGLSGDLLGRRPFQISSGQTVTWESGRHLTGLLWAARTGD